MVSAFLEQEAFARESSVSRNKTELSLLVNFHSAILYLGGFDLLSAVTIPKCSLPLHWQPCFIILAEWYLKPKWGPFFAALFIMGHIAFSNFLFALFGYLPPQMKLNLASWNDTKTLLLYPFFNFLSPIINYFHPKRPFLFGFPLGLILLSGIIAWCKKKSSISSFFRAGAFPWVNPAFSYAYLFGARTHTGGCRPLQGKWL